MQELIDKIEETDEVISVSEVDDDFELEVELENSLILRLQDVVEPDFSAWKIQPIYDNKEIEDVPGLEYTHPTTVAEGELIGKIQRYASVSRLRLGVMSIPDEKRVLHRLCTSISLRLNQLLNEKDMTVGELSEKVDKPKNYIRQALAGGIDFKLSTIAEFSAAFDDDVIESCFEVEEEQKERRRDV